MNNLPTLVPTPPFRYRNLKIPVRFFFAVINVNIFSDCHKLNFADWKSLCLAFYRPNMVGAVTSYS